MHWMLASMLALLVAMQATARAEEGGVDYAAVALRGTAFDPLGGDVLGVSFRVKMTLTGEISATGVFKCRPRPGWDATCPGRSGVLSMTFGLNDVIGPVSSGAIHVSFDDGSSCDFSGVMPLPPLSNGSSYFKNVSSPIVSFAGSYACHDANGGSTKTGDFFTTGGPPLPVPRCKGAVTPFCRPT